MIYHKLFLAFVVLISVVSVVSVVSAECDFVYQEDTEIDFKLPVYHSNNTKATNDTDCWITIRDADSNIVVDDLQMTHNDGGWYNYTIPASNVSTSGEYPISVRCFNTADAGFSTFCMEINPTGIRSTEERAAGLNRAVYLLFGIAIILFLGFLFIDNTPTKWTFFIVSITMTLIAVNMIFITLSDEVVNPAIESFFDSFTAISFYLYWFAGGLIFIIWILTMMNTWIIKKNEANIRKFGGKE